MTQQAEAVKSAIIALSPGERAEIVQFLLENLNESEAGPALDPKWDQELMRRFESIKSGKAVGVPASEVIAKLRGSRS